MGYCRFQSPPLLPVLAEDQGRWAAGSTEGEQAGHPWHWLEMPSLAGLKCSNAPLRRGISSSSLRGKGREGWQGISWGVPMQGINHHLEIPKSTFEPAHPHPHPHCNRGKPELEHWAALGALGELAQVPVCFE